jgi:hypothetical protein
MKIYEEREALYASMERASIERESTYSHNDSLMHPKPHSKIQTADPVVRNNQSTNNKRISKISNGGEVIESR